MRKKKRDEASSKIFLLQFATSQWRYNKQKKEWARSVYPCAVSLTDILCVFVQCRAHFGRRADRQSIYVEEGEEERREDFAIFFVGISRVVAVVVFAAANAIPPRSPCVRAVVCPLDALGQLPPLPPPQSAETPTVCFNLQ